jgi:hypothetical protein
METVERVGVVRAGRLAWVRLVVVGWVGMGTAARVGVMRPGGLVRVRLVAVLAATAVVMVAVVWWADLGLWD